MGNYMTSHLSSHDLTTSSHDWMQGSVKITMAGYKEANLEQGVTGKQTCSVVALVFVVLCVSIHECGTSRQHASCRYILAQYSSSVGCFICMMEHLI